MEKWLELIKKEDIDAIHRAPKYKLNRDEQMIILEAARKTGVGFFKELRAELNIEYETVLLFKKKISHEEYNLYYYLDAYARSFFLVPRYIAISGKIGAGKSTAAGIIVDYLKTHDNWRINTLGIKRTAFARKIKDLSAYVFETEAEVQNSQEGKNTINSTTGLTYGQLQQKIGSMFRENINPDFWINILFASLHPEENIYIIDDLRMRNEAAALKERGAIMIRINGDPAGINMASTRDKNHPTETDLDNYDSWDIIINNDCDIELFKEKLISKLSQFIR